MKHGHGPLLWFPWERMGEAGEIDVRLARLNNFSEFWGIELIVATWLWGD